MTRLALIAPAACLLVASCGGGGKLSVAPAHFRAAPSWHDGTQPVHACPGFSPKQCVQVLGWASTASYRDGENVPPYRTLAASPPDGIVIQELNSTERRPSRTPTGTWPPRISAQDVTAGFEGEPTTIGVFQYLTRTGSTERYLFVWFGRAHPTDEQLARANAELRTVYP